MIRDAPYDSIVVIEEEDESCTQTNQSERANYLIEGGNNHQQNCDVIARNSSDPEIS